MRPPAFITFAIRHAALIMSVAVLVGGCGSRERSEAMPRIGAAADGRSAGPPSLIVRHAAVFDTRNRRVIPNTTIVIRGDRIAAVAPDSSLANVRAPVEIDGRGRLVTPGLIDVHHHVEYAFPDSITPGGGAVARLTMTPDSIAAYRARWAERYLPYGVTVVREAGGNEEHLALMTAWAQPSPSAPDFIPSGGALASHEAGRVPFVGHAIVRDSADAAARVRRYHDAGLRDVKLYWRLREPEYVGAYTEARRLGMHVSTHVDFGVVSPRRALAIGVRHFEHAYTLGVGVMTPAEVQRAWTRTRQELGTEVPGGFYWGALEHFNMLGARDARLIDLIAELARAGATVTPTLHIFAQRVGLASHTTPSLGVFDRTDTWTPARMERARHGYRILAGYVRRLHEAGVPLAVGTDWLDPGRAVLSEMLLMHDAGIPIADVLAIATLGGARSLERETEYGAIDAGRRAHLVIFDRSPLDDPNALLGAKTVIKDGVVAGRQ
ncbi:MAG TPA: amidohydrolase family protein [Gemmatimonadaceae bacterium]|nr:amidohydrolase family protein [Gemmatimonadaceae bacterium]